MVKDRQGYNQTIMTMVSRSMMGVNSESAELTGREGSREAARPSPPRHGTVARSRDAGRLMRGEGKPRSGIRHTNPAGRSRETRGGTSGD